MFAYLMAGDQSRTVELDDTAALTIKEGEIVQVSDPTNPTVYGTVTRLDWFVSDGVMTRRIWL